MANPTRHGDTGFLDGVRGIAALAVVFSHLLFWFYPEAHIGNRAPDPSARTLWLFNSPFSFFYKGGYAVAIFFVLSGFVLTRACMQKGSHAYTAQAAAKRYIRLGGPVFVIVLLCALMRSLGLFQASAMGIKTFLSGAYGAPPEWMAAFRSAIYGAMLYGDRSYDYVLWTISIEFYGSLLVFASFALFGFDRRLLARVSAILAVFFAMQSGQSTYYFLFFAGAFLASRDVAETPTHSLKTAIPPIAIGIGLYLGGYAPASTSYHLISSTANNLQKSAILSLNWPILIIGIGATLVIYGLLATKASRSFLTKPPLRWLGNISFSLYLSHSLILTAVTPLAIKHAGMGFTAFLLAAAATCILTFVASHLLWKAVDLPFTQLANRFGSAIILGESCNSTPTR